MARTIIDASRQVPNLADFNVERDLIASETIRRRRSDKKEGHESGQQEYEGFTFCC